MNALAKVLAVFLCVRLVLSFIAGDFYNYISLARAKEQLCGSQEKTVLIPVDTDWFTVRYKCLKNYHAQQSLSTLVPVNSFDDHCKEGEVQTLSEENLLICSKDLFPKGRWRSW